MKNTRLIRKSAGKRLFVAMLALAVCALNKAAAQEYRDLFPASTQIIDAAPFSSTSNVGGLKILTVDSDGRVGLAIFRKSGDAFLKAGYRVLGQALWSSGNLNLRDRISANEVPIFETRLTNEPSATHFHAIVTALLSKNPERRHASKVYLFAERPDGPISLALVNQYDGLPDVVLDDVNGDSEPELVVESIEDTGKAGNVEIWAISSKDVLTQIDLPDDSQYLTGARTYFRHLEQRYYGPGNYTVIATASILKMAEPIERQITYGWNAKTNSYHITQVIDTSEKVTTIKILGGDSAKATH